MTRSSAPLGFSTRLALIVGAGFAVLQAIMLVLVLAQTASQQRGAGYPVVTRFMMIAEVVEDTAPSDHARLLGAISGREFSLSLVETIPGERYRVVEGRSRLGRANAGNAPLLARQIIPLETRPDAVGSFLDWSGWPNRSDAMAVALSTGGYLLVEQNQPGRRRMTALMILLANAVLGVAVVAAVWIFTRRLAAPLEAISERAESFASDLTAPPMQADVGPPEARRMAEAFNRLRSDVQGLMTDRMRMLAAVAHDLKTYLTRLHMRTSLISDPAHRDAADRDIKHMASLIEDVILAARGDEIPTALEPFDIGALIDDLVRARHDSGVEIEVTGVRADIWAHGSPAGIRRALDNLIDNAIAYAKGAEIAVSRQQDYWRIEIIDHGPGLPSGFEAVALDPFTRAEPSRNRETGGAGLGLFIASTLVRQSKANLALGPTPGGGLTATVVIATAHRL